jgi:hypothetical protein
MAEHHAFAKLNEPVIFDRLGGLLGYSEDVCGAPDDSGVSGWIGSRNQQECFGFWRQLREPTSITFLDLTRQRDRDRQAKPTRKLRRSQASGQLQ